MNILYVEFSGMTSKYGKCNAPAVYEDLYTKLRTWGSDGRRKMNLLAVF